ncbi:TPA: hypothetical protein ACQTWV_000446 [Enterobacter roggenkampii]
MKLIDILVRELPKLGGWPIGADSIYQNAKGHLVGVQGCIVSPVDMELGVVAEDTHRSVTREQYEAALAASKPEWNGDGLPPVGCRVEANFGGEWVEATVAYTDRPEGHSDAVAWKEALVFDCKTTRPFWADEFRPIRSEADKKKEAVEKAIADALLKDGDFDYSEALRLSTFVYGAISRNEIPHIRID